MNATPVYFLHIYSFVADELCKGISDLGCLVSQKSLAVDSSVELERLLQQEFKQLELDTKFSPSACSTVAFEPVTMKKDVSSQANG